jgi:hypothetical protein
VRLKNDIERRNILDGTICEFYKKNGNRIARRFLHSQDEKWNCLYSHFLIDRKHVIRYGILQDRGFWSGGMELATGTILLDTLIAGAGKLSGQPTIPYAPRFFYSAGNKISGCKRRGVWI